MDDYFNDSDLDYIFDDLCMSYGLTDEKASTYIANMMGRWKTNSISTSVIRRDVMEKVEERPGRYWPLQFLKTFNVEQRNEWIQDAIKKYDSLPFVKNAMWTDAANKCVFVKIYREVVKDRIKNHEQYDNVGYFDVLSHCEHKYPGSFLIVHDCK